MDRKIGVGFYEYHRRGKRRRKSVSQTWKEKPNFAILTHRNCKKVGLLSQRGEKLTFNRGIGVKAASEVLAKFHPVQMI